jgi:hypothetical protein
MSTLFITYLWHYLAARTLYDQVLRPVTRGHPEVLLLIALIAAIAFAVGQRSSRRRGR